jgi:hypothetical protein
MDLNQLYFDHQLLLMKARRAQSGEARRAHEIGASHIAGRIGCMQRSLGAACAPVWEALAVSGPRSLAAPARHQQGYAF